MAVGLKIIIERPIQARKAHPSVGGGYSGGGGSTGFVRHAFLLPLSSASLLSGKGTCEDFATPVCVAGRELFPIAHVDVHVYVYQ